MKKIACVLAAALLWTIPARASETVRSFSRQFPTDAVQRVDLDFSVGEVSIEAWDSPGVQLDMQLKCHRDSSSCREAAQNVRLVYSTDAGTLRIETKSWPRLTGHGLEAHIRVQMPRRLALKADLGVGQMEIAGLERDVKANLGVGQLNLTLPEAAVSTVHADTGVGEASLHAGGRHYESAGLITRALRWTKGNGTARVSADCGVGEIEVRLR
jgi:hypothetical protein